MKACLVPYNYGRSWFTFIEEPELDLKVEPIILSE